MKIVDEYGVESLWIAAKVNELLSVLSREGSKLKRTHNVRVQDYGHAEDAVENRVHRGNSGSGADGHKSSREQALKCPVIRAMNLALLECTDTRTIVEARKSVTLERCYQLPRHGQ